MYHNNIVYLILYRDKIKIYVILGKGPIMIKLICEKCRHIWYTANTRPNQKCSDCGGYLCQTELIDAKYIEKYSDCIDVKKIECKIIHLNFK
jgi:hypothetical protein